MYEWCSVNGNIWIMGNENMNVEMNNVIMIND